MTVVISAAPSCEGGDERYRRHRQHDGQRAAVAVAAAVSNPTLRLTCPPPDDDGDDATAAAAALLAMATATTSPPTSVPLLAALQPRLRRRFHPITGGAPSASRGGGPKRICDWPKDYQCYYSYYEQCSNSNNNNNYNKSNYASNNNNNNNLNNCTLPQFSTTTELSKTKIITTTTTTTTTKTTLVNSVSATICTCLMNLSLLSIRKLLVFLALLQLLTVGVSATGFDKSEQLLDKLNLEQSIAAVFNKVAYGSTTKRSIPDNAYPVTTLATPLLTTYRYSDGNDEWLRVDVKDKGRSNVDFENGEYDDKYGADLEKDHVLPTSAPAADILKNNNNKNYNNPNRYNNDRLRPDFQEEQVTENVYKTTTTYNLLRNVRPTKSMYSKDIPSYVPPSRAFFTPPLPKEFQNPFADKPTLRGTNSDGFASRRPIPPPSLMPSKDRIPYRPDLPKVNVEKALSERPEQLAPPQRPNHTADKDTNNNNNKKKTLNTPSQNVRIGEFYGLKNLNETSFEYEKSYAPEPSITRILSGSNGRQDDIQIPDILYRAVTATPPEARTKAPSAEPKVHVVEQAVLPKNYDDDNDDDVSDDIEDEVKEELPIAKKEVIPMESVTIKREPVPKPEDVTTQMSDMINLPNVKEKEANVTKASSDQIWLICWNVHVYLVVTCYILLAAYSIFKLIRYENDPHMFSKSYFLTIHLMLTVICVLRIFYLIYDPYNVNHSFNVFLYDFLHGFPLSLLATTFAVLILFLLKRTLTHLEVKTRPVFLVVFALLHIVLCFCLSIIETFGHFEKASLVVCRPIFVLLSLALGFSYLYLYRIIKNVLVKKSQNLSEMCTQNISYASHITIAVALLFILLGVVQLYALFSIKIDRFGGEIKHHWILWGFELSVRVLEISIITLLAVVVSLKMSQREKQSAGGFPLFPCTTSDSSTDNIYPNNCSTNPNVAMNYSRNEMILDNIPSEPVERPNLLKSSAFQNDSFDKKSTLERCYQQQQQQQQQQPSDDAVVLPPSRTFDRFERPNWSDRFEHSQRENSFGFDRTTNGHNSLRNERKKSYDTAKYYTKPKYDLEYNNEDYQHDLRDDPRNIYSEPVDGGGAHHHQYERTRHEFERNDFDRRSRNSSNTSGRRSTGRSRKNHARPHLGVQTLPNHEGGQTRFPDSMLVDELGFVRFGQISEAEGQKPKKSKIKMNNGGSDISHFSDA